MAINNLELVQGNEFTIIELVLSCENLKINLMLRGLSKENEVMIQCFNISHLNIQNLSAPMQISGLEIICNKSKGWERTSNYTIRDFEENRIEFFVKILKSLY